MSATAPAEAPAAPPRKKLLGKPAFIGLLLLVVSVGMAGAFLVILSGGSEPEDDEEIPIQEVFDSVEVQVDSFSTTNGRAAPGSVIHTTFKLTAVVPLGQEIEFERLANQQNNGRVRQAVEKIVRSANLDDLNDPNLATIKRQLREEINKILKKSYVSEIVISDFKMMEQ